MDEELQEFANDVYDILADNARNITILEFRYKYMIYKEADIEIDCATNTISIGDFQIKISRKD